MDTLRLSIAMFTICVAANVTVAQNLTMTSVGRFSNVTEICVSDKIPILTSLVLPHGTHDVTLVVGSDVTTDNVFSVCDVEVSYIGSNLNGVQTTPSTVSFQRLGNGSYQNPSTTIDLGTITNSGSSVLWNASEVRVLLQVVVTNSNAFTVGGVYSVIGDATLDNGAMQFLASLNFTAVSQNPPSPTSQPLISLSGPTSVKIGDVANLTLMLTLVDPYNALRIEARVNGTYTFPACDVILDNIGDSFACLEGHWSEAFSDGYSQIIDIPIVINTGFNEGGNANNNLTFKILTRIPTYVTPANMLNVVVDVYLDGNLPLTSTTPLTLSINTIASPTSVPVVAVDALSSVRMVAKGSALIAVVNVSTPPGVVMIYDIRFTTTTGKASICDVQLMKIGANLCADDKINATFTSSDSSAFNDGANVTYGAANIDTAASSLDADNFFRYEVVVCVPVNSPVSVGANLSLRVEVRYDVNNSSKNIIATLPFNVSSSVHPMLSTGNASVCNTTGTSGYISQTVEVNVTAVFMGTTADFSITVSTQVNNNTALATLNHVSIARIGSNLVCMENRTLTLVSMTTVSHSQVTSLTYNLGPVSHPGFEGRSELINPSNNTREDEIEFKVSLLISDHVMNTQGSFIAIATTLTGNNGVPSTGHTSVGVLVTETERPELIISFLMETFLHTQKMSGDNVTCTVLLRSTNTSTAHAQDVAVHVLTPPYVGFGQLIDAVDANVTVTTDPATGITFKISEIDFTDNVSFIFNLVLDPNRALPVGLMHVSTVLPVDVTYRGAHRPDRADTGELYSDIIVKEFGFHTGIPAALGIESGTVQACQLTASSSRASNPPTQARLNGSGGWKPLVRGAPFCGKEYLQVDFGSSAYITGIRLQSSTDDAQNVMTSFYVSYSEDSYAWYNVTDNGGFATKEFSINVPGNANVNDAYDITLNETQHFWTRYVRLVSTDTRCSVGARIELLGVKQASAPVDCATLETYVSPVPDQSYVVNPTTGTVFVCGLTQIHGEVACSRSDQTGAYWQAIDDNVGYVIGVIDNTSDVIGVSRDSTAHLLSEDDGITWDVLTNEHLAELLSQPGYVSATVFPYGDYRDVTVNTMYNNHGVNGPGFTLTGVMEGVAVKDGGPWNVLAWWGTQDWDLL